MIQHIVIRPETAGDIGAIRDVTVAAFLTHPFSSQTEQHIIAALRRAGALSLSLVALLGDQVIAHAAFSPVQISDGATGWLGLGPVAVLPQMQCKGIGQQLIRHGLARIREHGAHGCVVLGDPDYYRRLGFTPDPQLQLPGVPADHFLALRFTNVPACGIVSYHAAFAARE